MTVRVEPKGPVTTVIIDRPEVRNAVDGPTAAALAEAFADFDADPDASVAVLFGAGGTFCAGADLKAIGSPNGNRTDSGGNAPMGPTRMHLSKPVIAAIRVTPSPAAWNWRSGATCGWHRRTPCLACSAAAGACRSWMAARSGCRRWSAWA